MSYHIYEARYAYGNGSSQRELLRRVGSWTRWDQAEYAARCCTGRDSNIIDHGRGWVSFVWIGDASGNEVKKPPGAFA